MFADTKHSCSMGGNVFFLHSLHKECEVSQQLGALTRLCFNTIMRKTVWVVSLGCAFNADLSYRNMSRIISLKYEFLSFFAWLSSNWYESMERLMTASDCMIIRKKQHTSVFLALEVLNYFSAQQYKVMKNSQTHIRTASSIGGSFTSTTDSEVLCVHGTHSQDFAWLFSSGFFFYYFQFDLGILT